MTRIAAFDLSLVATGFATSYQSATSDQSGVVRGEDRRGVDRLRFLRDCVLELAGNADVVLVEGYAYGAKGNAVISLGELGGVVRLALADAGHLVVEVPPACVKLYATGKGNIPKDAMLAAAIRKLDYQGHDHNEVDALWMLEMAEHRYDVQDEGTQFEVRALAGVKWPELKDRVAA